MKGALLIAGAVLQLLGILLVASPDLVPGALRAAGWTRTRWQTLTNRVRRLLGLPARQNVHVDAMTGTMTLSGSLEALVTFDPERPLEDQVTFLLGRDLETQKMLSSLGERISAIESESPKRLSELRDAMETHVSREVIEALADKRMARVCGAAALIVGLALTTTASWIN